MPTLDNSTGDMFRFYAKRRRLPRWGRLVIALALVGVIYLFTVQRVQPSSWADEVSASIKSRSPPPAPLADRLRDTPMARRKQLPLTTEDEVEDPPPRVSKSKSKSQSESKVESPTVVKEDFTQPDRFAAPVTPHGASDSKLDQALKHVFSIYPDELHVRELLRPIENSGKERMRELGLRARQFREMLDSWEAIHLVQTKDRVLVRDDIIPYLSKVKDTTGISAVKSRAEIMHAYENFRYFLTKLSEVLFPWTAPYFADHMTLHASIKHGGRGIVLSGGDGQLKYMMTSIRSIRALGCDLPIEVLYLGDDDLGDDSRSELEAEDGVITRDMKQMVHDEGWDLRGWAGKPFAILLSSFREVIFIDADAMFLVSPEELFNDPAYKETGTLFFRDRLMFPESKRKWLQQILPKPMSKNVRASRFWTGESGHYQESGVVLVDKWRHFMAMLMVTRMNGPDRDGNEEKGIIGTYDMVYGDKETFWLGWELVGDTEYAFHPGEAGNMGVARADYEEARAWVLGNIADAQKLSQEAEEQRKIEEDRRREEDQAKKQEAAKAEKEKTAAARRKLQVDKEAEEAKKADEAKASGTAAEGDKTASDKPEPSADVGTEAKKDTEGAGKTKAYDSPPSVEDGETLASENALPADDATDSADVATKPAAAEKAADEKPAPDDDSYPGTRRVKRGLDDDEAPRDSITDSRGPDRASHFKGPKPTEYTICSPQLLHLDRNNRPLWFNGWILDNKFDQDHPRLSSFEAFMLERKEGATEAGWRLEESNLCCLTSDAVYDFTKAEKKALDSIVSIAKEVGAVGKR